MTSISPEHEKITDELIEKYSKLLDDHAVLYVHGTKELAICESPQKHPEIEVGDQHILKTFPIRIR